MNKFIADNVNAMQGYTPGEQPKFADIIKLNTNENPYPPSPKVNEAIAQLSIDGLRRYPDPVAIAVRTRIAEMHGCPVDCVFAGNGSDEVLAVAIKCFTHDGGSIGCFYPTYSLYPVLAEIRNVSTKEIPLNDDFTWRTPPSDYKPDLFFLTNPNAPTAIQYDKETIKDFCAKFDGVVLIDEAYADFAAYNCMDLATAEGNTNVIVSRTLSKSYSLAGLRFGYCVGPKELIDAMYKVKDSYNLNGITQPIALAALNDIEYMKSNTKKIISERTRMEQELAKLGWSFTQSQTNFIFARPPNGNAAEIFAMLKEKHIFVRYFSMPKISEYLRITIGTPEENNKLLEALKA